MTHPESADIPTIPMTHAELAAVAKNTGCNFDGSRLLLPFFGTYHTLTTTGIQGPHGSRISNKIEKILTDYVHNYPVRPPPTGRLFSYRELKGAGPLVVSFANNTLKTITTTFAGKLAELVSAARSLGANPRPDIPGYDLSVEFMALPGIPLTLQFNDAEAPFPAQSSLVLDDSIETYLDMQAIFTLGTFLCGRLVTSCYN